MPNFNFQNRIVESTFVHPDLQRAREQGDKEKEAAIIARLPRLPNGGWDPRGYIEIDRFAANNINTVEGKKAALDLITGQLANAGRNWYIAPYESDSTPDDTWDGDFGAGVYVTEFIRYTDQGDASQRAICLFDLATGSSGQRTEVTNSVRARLNIGAGVTAQNIYGICVTDQAAFNYSGGAGILLAAVRYPAAKVYNTGEVKYIGYQIYIP